MRPPGYQQRTRWPRLISLSNGASAHKDWARGHRGAKTQPVCISPATGIWPGMETSMGTSSTAEGVAAMRAAV